MSVIERERSTEAQQVAGTPIASETCLHHLFEAQARLTRDAVAACCGLQQISYHALNARANVLAHALLRDGIQIDEPVAICMERGIDLLAALLGILKAGAAYVPLDARNPESRLRWMLADSGARLVIATEPHAGRLRAPTARVLRPRDVWAEALATPSLGERSGGAVAQDEAAPNPRIRVHGENVAYIMYTSGSTGRPKGVAVSHASVVALLRWSQTVFSAEEQSLVLASTSFAFDISVFELFATLARGGTVMLVEDVLHIADAPAARLINTVPSALSSLLAHAELPASVRTICLSGEALPDGLVHQIVSMPGRTRRVVSLYGPTETTIFASWLDVVSAGHAAPPLGRPLAGARLYVLDEDHRLASDGELGELYIGGHCLARGYWRRPELTAEKFVPDPFAATPGARMYASGDLARRLPDGSLEFHGRRDSQVKIRGYRVELGDIETALGMHPAVQSSAVVLRTDEPGGRRLVAYIVARTHIDDAALLSYLRERLPEYEVPATFVRLAKLPLTASGKLDRQSLPRPGGQRLAVAGTYEPLLTSTEQSLAELWSTLLDVSPVGRNDNFFDMGGHSLLAMQLLSRIVRTFGVELPVRVMFEAQTVQQLATAIDRAADPHTAGLEIHGTPASSPQRSPLTSGQESLWFLAQLQPESQAYNVVFAYHLRGALNRDVLDQALRRLRARHEALHVTFVAEDGVPMQVADQIQGALLELVDLGGLPVSERSGEAARAVDAAARRPIDLAQGPIMRAKLWKLDEREHVLFLCVHHIVFDTWSQDIFFWELETLYAAYLHARDPALPPIALDLSAYAARQSARQTQPQVEIQMAHWLERLRPPAGKSIPLIQLPWDHARPALRGFLGARHPFVIPDRLWERLRTLGRQEGVTLFMTLLAGFQTLLLRLSGQEDLYIGAPVADRSRQDTEGLIGFLVNNVVLRTDLSGNPSFRELLARVCAVVVDALANQDTPYDKLVARLRPERSPSREPLFQVMFAYDTLRSDGLRLDGIESTELEIDNGTSKFDLLLMVTSMRSGVRTALEYDGDLFEGPTIARLADTFVALLDAIVADPDERIGRLAMPRALEQSGANATSVPYERDATIPELFAAQVTRTPDAIALEMGDERLTYRALDERAARLACRLLAHGVRLESPVAVFLERSLDSVVAVLAIVKAGACYVPVGLNMPSERCAYIVADTDARVMLTRRSHARELPLWHGTAPEVLCIEEDDAPERAAPAAQKLPQPGADNLAYVMYTSGSTGHPKGVAATHRAVLRLVRNAGYADLGADQTLAHFAPLAFDASTFEIWGSLLNGARLVIVPEAVFAMSELAGVVERKQVTTLWLTAALFHEFVAAVPRLPVSLRQLLAGGDVLLAPIVQTALRQWHGCRIINGYGPTEGTTFTCCYTVADGSALAQGVPIGRPIGNTHVYVLDERMRPVPVGVEGELYIGGDGLARGYLNRPDLTAELFVPDPFADEPGGRLYRSGDRVRYRADGAIEFLGRKDRQVKIRGFRVEPAEIEQALVENSAVRAAAVVAAKDSSGDTRLIAYVVGRGGPPSVAALREYLGGRLPEYMVPAAWLTLPALPVTANGKVDLRSLPAPQPAPAARHVLISPHDQAEQRLLAIWEELLNVKPIGVRDNFFALGGHSLTAIRVMSRIDRQLGVKLPVSMLFRAPTIEMLAAAVRGSQTIPDWTTLVPIQPEGNRPPFFCVHGLGGGVVDYGELARQLGRDQPFYGLQAQGLDGSAEPHPSIEAMAAHYVEAIRSFQPHGPYYLGGYCFGGVVAYEMARQLAAQGQVVGLLAILEGYAVAQQGPRRWLRTAQLQGVVRNLPYWLQDYGTLKLRRAFAKVRGRDGTERRLEQQRIWNRLSKIDARAAHSVRNDQVPDVYRRLIQSQIAAVTAHRSGRYAGRVTLFRVRALAFALADDPQMGWGRLSQAGVTIRMIPGAHYNILSAPYVARLAAELRASLDAAQANGRERPSTGDA